jgi:hypothetical protein
MSLDTFDDAAQKRKNLLAIFDTLPTITLYGVVDANGPGGSNVPPENHWSLHLNLIAWRIPGSSVNCAQLSVTKDLSDEELDVLQNAIDSESIIAFRGKLCEHSPFGDARAQLDILLDQPIDEALETVLSQYRELVEIVDPLIGKLVLNKTVDWFEGKITWLGKEVDIAISVDESGSPSDSLKTVKILLKTMEQWAKKVNNYAVTQLLDLKNDNWLEEDENPISSDDFIRRMQLRSLTTYPGGAFEFGHDDGDLFWGHSIAVSGSLAEGLTDAGISG